MPQTLKKLGAYWFWLVHASVRPFIKISLRVLKFHIFQFIFSDIYCGMNASGEVVKPV